LNVADIVEALKAEFIREADALKSGNPSQEELQRYHVELEEWIRQLHAAYRMWSTKGSREWPAVKRIAEVNWWVDQPEGRNALMR
jgi:hypothetical protein